MRRSWPSSRNGPRNCSRYSTEGRLKGRDDVVENMMRFVFATEDATERLCGVPNGMDELLATIGHHRWGNQ